MLFRSEWLAQVRQRLPELDEKRAKNVALVEHLDNGIGRVLGALKDQGIVAHVIEDHSSKITGEAFVPRSRVMVRSSDLVEAAEVINDVLSGDASFDLATDLEFDDNSAEVPGLRTPLE